MVDRLVAPSILSADFARLGAQVEEVLAAGARVIRVDVMDGHFVPSISFGGAVLAAIADRVHAAGAIVDAHVMIEHPERHVADILHDLDPGHVVRARGYVNPVWQQKTARWLARRPQCAQVRIARDEIARIRELTKAINDYERELAALVEAHSPQLLELAGCQALTAAKLIGETGPIGRFRTASKYARFTATAPIPASSGNTNRHRLDRGGNRQLNAAIHRIAITQVRWHPPANAYYQRKLTEGKTRKEALRCLKRQIIRTIYRLLRAQSPGAPTSPQPSALRAPTAPQRRRISTHIICNPPIH
jgi:hypothetical protein